MAKDEKNIIDRLFTEGLEGAEAPVPNDLWEGIAARMETDTLRKKVFYARFTAAASLLMLLGLSTWFFISWNFQESNTTSTQLSNNQVISLPFKVMGTPLRLPDAFGADQDGASTAPGPSDSQRTDGLNFATTSNGINLGNGTPSGRSALLGSFFIDQYGSSKGDNTSDLPVGEEVASDAKDDKGSALVKTSPLSNGFAMDKPSENMDAVLPLETDPIAPVLASNFNLKASGVHALAPLKAGMDIEDSQAIIAANLRSPALFDPESSANAAPSQSASGRRWAMGGAFAPDYSFASTSPVQNQLNASSRTINLQEPIQAEKETSPLVSAFTTGMNLSFRINDRMGLQSGLFYTNRQSSATSNLNSFGKALVVNSDFSLNLLEIPLLFQYSLIHQDNFDYYVSSGISANLLWNYNNTISNAEGQVSARLQSADKQTFQPSQGNLLLRTGIRYKMFSKVSLNIEPGMRYGLLTNDYAFSDGRPISLSLNSGINYHF